MDACVRQRRRVRARAEANQREREREKRTQTRLFVLFVFFSLRTPTSLPHPPPLSLSISFLNTCSKDCRLQSHRHTTTRKHSLTHSRVHISTYDIHTKVRRSKEEHLCLFASSSLSLLRPWSMTRVRCSGPCRVYLILPIPTLRASVVDDSPPPASLSTASRLPATAAAVCFSSTFTSMRHGQAAPLNNAITHAASKEEAQEKPHTHTQ